VRLLTYGHCDWLMTTLRQGSAWNRRIMPTRISTSAGGGAQQTTTRSPGIYAKLQPLLHDMAADRDRLQQLLEANSKKMPQHHRPNWRPMVEDRERGGCLILLGRNPGLPAPASSFVIT